MDFWGVYNLCHDGHGVFGACEWETSRCILEQVRSWQAATLLSVTEDWVVPLTGLCLMGEQGMLVSCSWPMVFVSMMW